MLYQKQRRLNFITTEVTIITGAEANFFALL